MTVEVNRYVRPKSGTNARSVSAICLSLSGNRFVVAPEHGVLRRPREVRRADMSSVADLRGREKARPSPRASRRHGAIHVLPYSGGQNSVGLVAAGDVLAVAGGFPVSDQALVVAREFPFVYPCSA